MKKIKLNMAKFVTRCSSLPLLFSCPNAIRNPEKLQEVRVENDAAGLGTDIHAAIQHTVETGEVDLRKIEAKHTPENVERAKELYANGLRVVEEAKRDMRNPQFEVEVSFETEKFVVTGHVDMVDINPDRAYVVDFKTGRTRDDHYQQMVGYAVGVWTKVGRPDSYIVHVAYVYLETSEITSFDLTATDFKAWVKELDSLVEQYQVNRRCIYCPLNNTCPAFRDYLKGSLTLLLEVAKLPSIRVRALPAAMRAKLTVAMKMGKTAIDRIREHVKEETLKNGDLSTGDGNKFIIRTREYKTLLTSRALPIIAKYVTPKDIANASKLSLSDLISAAARRVKGPMRKIVREEMLKRLKAAGAVVVTDSPYLETVVEHSQCHEKNPKKKSSKSTRPAT